MALTIIAFHIFLVLMVYWPESINATTPVNEDTIKSYITVLRSAVDPNGRNGFDGTNDSREANIFSTLTTSKKHAKKWQVGRVSRKHYEIINMLWRKPKIFSDEETITEINPRRDNGTNKVVNGHFPNKLHTFIPTSMSPASTQSFIEFYYLDEAEDVKETSPRYVKYIGKSKEQPNRHFGNLKLALLNPIFAFHINNPHYKRTALPTRYMQPSYRKPRTYKSPLVGFKFVSSLTRPYTFPHKLRLQDGVTNYTRPKRIPFINKTQELFKNFTSETKYFDNETCPSTTEELNAYNETENGNSNLSNLSSTAYDKIKFFEIYDRNTYEPNFDKRKSDIEFIAYEKEHVKEKKILLEHVDQNMEHDQNHNKTKHAKKHIIENNRRLSWRHETNNQSEKKLHFTLSINKTTVDIKKKSSSSPMDTESELYKLFHKNGSKFVTWSEYPFAAVYIYEPLQVYCDAASINRHWLITSGSCLSRHHKRPGGTGQSAFVTYCGNAWWSPERVAYVKYSVVHPSYHSRNIARQYLYNIGLIEVVNSMASCPGWSPIPLMSHQLMSDDGGSTALAIGWGLDRFDTRYPSTDLPKLPLSLYEDRVYLGSCPGNVMYDKVKRLDEDGSINNVYCLKLPPYITEESDPVHGGLLLVGGNLIALYLQEERRPWGEQCAQYTGTWRLIPWVLEVAREPDEADTFNVDI